MWGERMKRFIIILCLLFFPILVSATGGGLRKASIKTCPNGVTYGLHSDGQGGTHWHVAVTNGDNYYADGAAIYSDPCPGYTKNQGTAGDTDGAYNKPANNGGTNNSSSTYNNHSNNNSYNNNSNSYSKPANNNTNKNSVSSGTNSTNKKAETSPPVVKKSNDNSINNITIDDKDVSISDNMHYTTTKKRLDLDVKPKDSKATVTYDKKDLVLGENVVNIIVTAENGDKKEYVLNINRVKGKGSATIKKFILNSGEVTFTNNKATYKKLKNESSLDYSYELSDKNAKLFVYLNDKEVKKLDDLKDSDVITLKVLDEDDNENLYYVTITDASLLYSIFVYWFAALILISPIIIVVALFVLRKSKNKKIINAQ